MIQNFNPRYECGPGKFASNENLRVVSLDSSILEPLVDLRVIDDNDEEEYFLQPWAAHK